MDIALGMEYTNPIHIESNNVIKNWLSFIKIHLQHSLKSQHPTTQRRKHLDHGDGGWQEGNLQGQNKDSSSSPTTSNHILN